MRWIQTLSVAFVLLASARMSPGSELRVGDPFPIIGLPSLEDGSPSSVRDFAGRKLMLHVWASW